MTSRASSSSSSAWRSTWLSTPVKEARLILAAAPPFFPPPGFSFSSNAWLRMMKMTILMKMMIDSPFVRQTWSCRGEEQLALCHFCFHPALELAPPGKIKRDNVMRMQMTSTATWTTSPSAGLCTSFTSSAGAGADDARWRKRSRRNEREADATILLSGGWLLHSAHSTLMRIWWQWRSVVGTQGFSRELPM